MSIEVHQRNQSTQYIHFALEQKINNKRSYFYVWMLWCCNCTDEEQQKMTVFELYERTPMILQSEPKKKLLRED